MFLFTTLLIMLVVIAVIIVTFSAAGAVALGLIFGDLIVFGLIIAIIVKLIKK